MKKAHATIENKNVVNITVRALHRGRDFTLVHGPKEMFKEAASYTSTVGTHPFTPSDA